MSFNADTGGVFNALGLSLIVPAAGDVTHERAVIREYLTARLTAALDDATRVHLDPLLPHQARVDEWKLPAFNLSLGAETSEVATSGPEQALHSVELVVDVIASELAGVDLDRTLDQLELGVKKLILDPFNYPLSIYEVVPTGSEPTFSDGGARRLGRRRLTFRVAYHTALTEPVPAV